METPDASITRMMRCACATHGRRTGGAVCFSSFFFFCAPCPAGGLARSALVDADMARGAALGTGESDLVAAAEAVGVGGRRRRRGGGGAAHHDMVTLLAMVVAVVVMVVMMVVAVVVMVVMMVVAAAALGGAGVVPIAVVVMALEVGVEEE